MPGYGQNTDVDTAAEPLVAASTPVLSGVVVKVIGATSVTAYFGNNDQVTAGNGFPVIGGDQQSFDVGFFDGDLANLHVIGSTTNMTVAYWYY